MANPNYFTCTLGQAITLGLTNISFQNIPELISTLAEQHGTKAAVGFAIPPASRSEKQTWLNEVYSFADLQRGSTNLALEIKKRLGNEIRSSGTVALISPSTPEFLLTWLALMRLGLAVLHVAPQCQPAAIAHLCSSCGVNVCFYDDAYKTLAASAAEQATRSGKTAPFKVVPLFPGPSTHLTIAELLANAPEPHDPFPSPDAGAVAYLHHTSGTSSGVPKPIPQSHRAGAGVLPCFDEADQPATFTTTPLYHGGIADCFRAWTSGAFIWLFPGRVAITARNVVACLDVADVLHQQGRVPRTGYFSSVPYVLQSLEVDEQGMQYLKSMDIVGVGGAALPVEVGDRLVARGVRLISRFGSAECGFVMSSHRDYSSDKEWQYLRADQGRHTLLQFEDQEGDDQLAELVIGPQWPHMAKRNRNDGSFATADLFVHSRTVSNGWKYHSRADSQLTLVTGKKFDPAPLEDAMASASKLLSDVLIFGNGQPYPGALLFRSDAAMGLSDSSLVSRIWPEVERLNAESQGHARLLQKMLVPMPKLDQQQPLEKSSKGTVIRSAAEKRFASEIAGAYTRAEDDEDDLTAVPDDKVLAVLVDKILALTGRRDKRLEPNADLFSHGVDSVAGMQLRNTVRHLISAENLLGPLPLDIVEDCGTAERLAAFVLRTRCGGKANDEGEDDDIALMHALVEKYSDFISAGEDPITNSAQETRDTNGTKEVVLLTGTTGGLGAHLLDLYSHDDKVEKVYCLVRGCDDHASSERVRKSLKQRGLRPLVNDKVVVYRSDLGDASLGLNKDDYSRLCGEVSVIVHAAWSVNFRMRLRSFERDSIAGVTNLINLAVKSTRPLSPIFGFCSSVASVLSCGVNPIPEAILSDARAATSLGYSKSKWVAEQVCDVANTGKSSRSAAGGRLCGRVVVFRVGQLSGDSIRGIWNASEAWPMMLSTVKVTGSLPDLADESLDWLPVDSAALAIVQGVRSRSTVAKRHQTGDSEGRSSGGETSVGSRRTVVLHIVNEGRNPSWREMLGWLQQEVKFDVVSPGEWVQQLEGLGEGGTHSGHPALRLLEMWKTSYGKGDGYGGRGLARGAGEKEAARTTFAMEKTRSAIEALREVKAPDRDYLLRLWRWIDETM